MNDYYNTLHPVPTTMTTAAMTGMDHNEVSTVKNLTQQEFSSVLSNAMSYYNKCDEKVKTSNLTLTSCTWLSKANSNNTSNNY